MMFPEVKESFTRTDLEELDNKRSDQAAEQAGPSNNRAETQSLVQDCISSISSLSEIDDDEDDDIRHTIFKTIKIHTAKCDVCNQHNKATLRRCIDCGWQICTPCWDARGGDGTHGVSHKFNGPVFTPETPDSIAQSKGISEHDSDETVSISGENGGGLKSRSKIKVAGKGKRPIIRDEEEYGSSKRRVSQRVLSQDKGKGRARESKVSRRKLPTHKGITATRKSASTIPSNKIGTKRGAVVADGDNVNTDDESEYESTGKSAGAIPQQLPPEIPPDDRRNPMYWLCMAAQRALNEEKAREQWRQELVVRQEATQVAPSHTRMRSMTIVNKTGSPLFVPSDSFQDPHIRPAAEAANLHLLLHQSAQDSRGIQHQQQASFHPINATSAILHDRDDASRYLTVEHSDGNATRGPGPSRVSSFAGYPDLRWTAGYSSPNSLCVDYESAWARNQLRPMWADNYAPFQTPVPSPPLNEPHERPVINGGRKDAHGRPWNL
ncbi:hypothetical protein DIZ76_011319 [Coccidioides immitis]|nr:hypothetical protein DIZ76_011319 [Coccidioides immitis]